MNINQNPISSGNQMPPPIEHKSVGPVAGAIIIIVLLVAGGLYFWGAKINNASLNEVPYIPDDGSVIEESKGDSMVGLPEQSSSDDAAAIEADLNAMDLEAIDSENSAELNNI